MPATSSSRSRRARRGVPPRVLPRALPRLLGPALLALTAGEALAVQGVDLFDEGQVRTLTLNFYDPAWPALLDDPNVVNYTPEGTSALAYAALAGLGQAGTSVTYGGGWTFLTAHGQQNMVHMSMYPLEVEFPDELGDFDELRLKNSVDDSAHMKKSMAMRIFRRHTLAPRTAFVGVDVGPVPAGIMTFPGLTLTDPAGLGLYLHLEHLEKRFVQRHFDADDGFRFEFGQLGTTLFTPPALPSGIQLLGSAADVEWDCSLGDCPQQLVLDVVEALVQQTPGTPAFRQQLAEALDVDAYLWFLACWLTVQDQDGYQSKFVEDRANGRLVAVPQDTNRSFVATAGTDAIGPPTIKGGLTTVTLQDPHLALRYLHHLRHVVRDTAQPSLWNGLGAVYEELLGGLETGKDLPLWITTTSVQDVTSGGSLQTPTSLTDANQSLVASNFADVVSALTARHQELVTDPLLNRTELSIPWTDAPAFVEAGLPVPIQAQVIVPPGMGEVTLYWRTSGAYQPLPMLDDGNGDDALAGDLVHTATIPAQAAGAQLEYYVEALFLLDLGTWPDVFDPACPSSATYFPVGAERAPLRSQVTDAFAASSVVLNEFLVGDGGGDTNEWVELFNAGATTVSIAGWRVDDDAFGVNLDPADGDAHVVPAGTLLAPGGFYLVPCNQGAVFDLNHKSGTLAVRDDQDRLVALHRYRRQVEHVSQGRLHDGAGPFVPYSVPTPGGSNGTPADHNGDGVVNTADLLVVLGQVGQFGLNLATDLNGDWVVDPLDVALQVQVQDELQLP